MLVNFNKMLKDAQTGGYAVGLFNTIDLDCAQAVLEAAEELRSPVIIGTAEVLRPYGELDVLAPSLKAMAEKVSVPVALNYDHGLTFQGCMDALKLGFTSIMFDGSLGTFQENMELTAEMVRIAHAMGASVEGEIGHVGDVIKGEGNDADAYTTPAQAMEYIEKTGVDALAVAIGTAHGTYVTKPKLDVERLKQIRAAVDTPLVLHGGSGLTDEDFRNTIAGGITKINIYTDVVVAGKEALQKAFADGLCLADARTVKVAGIKEAVKAKMTLFGSVGKA